MSPSSSRSSSSSPILPPNHPVDLEIEALILSNEIPLREMARGNLSEDIAADARQLLVELASVRQEFECLKRMERLAGVRKMKRRRRRQVAKAIREEREVRNLFRDMTMG